MSMGEFNLKCIQNAADFEDTSKSQACSGNVKNSTKTLKS